MSMLQQQQLYLGQHATPAGTVAALPVSALPVNSSGGAQPAGAAAPASLEFTPEMMRMMLQQQANIVRMRQMVHMQQQQALQVQQQQQQQQQQHQLQQPQQQYLVDAEQHRLAGYQSGHAGDGKPRKKQKQQHALLVSGGGVAGPAASVSAAAAAPASSAASYAQQQDAALMRHMAQVQAHDAAQREHALKPTPPPRPLSAAAQAAAAKAAAEAAVQAQLKAQEIEDDINLFPRANIKRLVKSALPSKEPVFPNLNVLLQKQLIAISTATDNKREPRGGASTRGRVWRASNSGGRFINCCL